ncbi:MAG: histidine--tRNA ligase [Planctomycetota bacterium]|nr:MAG: histidine--tRNA ligase [Planctomycetota bacterium]
MIEPRTLKGFRDFLPAAMIPRERLIDTARRVYRSYGFAPIDTPALEYTEILLGKGGAETDKQMFRFHDSGGRDVAMRFDLTVPLARFVAQHAAELGMPFKRYHIATVWRGENTQRGRYREFMQCDFDTIGTRSIASDIETTLVVHELFLAIGFTDFEIHINNRKVLTGLLDKLGLGDKATLVLRALDKLAKIGAAKVGEEIVATTGATSAQVDAVLGFATLAGTNDAILDGVAKAVAGNARGEEGAADLRAVLSACAAAGVPADRLKLDVAIARGLDYYTGTIYETFLTKLSSIGSVCSGGRYDNLAGLYTKQELPGVGASLGLDRLLTAMEELGMLPKAATPAEALVAYFDAERLHDYLALAALVRKSGIGVEVYPEPKKLGQQLKYADHRGFRVALIAGSNELAAGQCQVKDLKSGTSEAVALADVPAAIARLLAEG